MWLGSADLMPRNVDRRVEVLAPVEDIRLRARVGLVLVAWRKAGLGARGADATGRSAH